MRPETGSNFSEYACGVEDNALYPAGFTREIQQRELSIQVTLNGFSFVARNNEESYYSDYTPFEEAGISRLTDYDPILDQDYSRILVGFTTDNTLLIPRELFDPACSDLYLCAANMYNGSAMETLYNDTLCDLVTPSIDRTEHGVAVWQTDSLLINGVLETYPSAYLYNMLQLSIAPTHPMQSVEIAVENYIYSDQTIATAAHIVVRDATLSSVATVTFHTPEELLYYTRNMIRQDGFTGYRVHLSGVGADTLGPFFSRFFASVEVDEDPYYSHHRILEK